MFNKMILQICIGIYHTRNGGVSYVAQFDLWLGSSHPPSGRAVPPPTFIYSTTVVSNHT